MRLSGVVAIIQEMEAGGLASAGTANRSRGAWRGKQTIRMDARVHVHIWLK